MLTSLAFIFLVGLLLGGIFRRLRLPALVGMLLAGILLGPSGVNRLDASILAISPELRQLALVVILTRAGLALNWTDLKQVGRPAILMCFVPACFEIAGMLLFAPRLVGVSLMEAAIMGSVVAAVSPAVIVPKMLRMMEKGIGAQKGIPQLIMAGASVDDVFVIVLFTSFTSLAAQGHVSVSHFLQIPLAILSGVVAGLGTGYLLARIFKRIHMRDSAKALVWLGVSFLLLALEHTLETHFPFSALLAIMAAGSALLKAHPIAAKRLSAKFAKLWVAAEIVLFVLVGATVDIQYAAISGAACLLLIFGTLLFRMAGVYFSLLKTSLSLRERLFCMVAYTPKATVQAAIGGIPLAMGLPCGPIVLTVAVLSILFTAPLGAYAIDKTLVLLNERPDKR